MKKTIAFAMIVMMGLFGHLAARKTRGGFLPQGAARAEAGTGGIVRIDPPSSLLAPGTKSLELTVQTAAATQCAYGLGEPAPFGNMVLLADEANGTVHRSTISFPAPHPNTVNTVYVRCADEPDTVAERTYRVRANVNPSFPRTGNLWGWWQWRDRGLKAMSRIDLWLGADGATPEEIRQLRTLNPNVLVFTSINAVENNDVPEDFFLRDVNGKKIEVWPGSYRLNLTRTDVAEYQARYALKTLVDRDFLPDGVFFDNVFTSQSWQTHDIYGHPIQIDADGNGVADDPAVLDAAWKAGVLHEIETFRSLAPNALVSGHAMNIDDGLGALFNGISIGFQAPYVIEGRSSFDSFRHQYNAWHTNALAPHVTMVEGAPPTQISYGYDYEPLRKIPSATLRFAQRDFPYMRFALAFTLMNDGYFSYELGDTWHGNPWWYDELNFNLGHACGPAQRAAIPFDPGPNRIENSGFEQPIEAPWALWVDTGSGYRASLSRDESTAAEGAASARIDVSAAGIDAWRVTLQQFNRSLSRGVAYDVKFWARSDRPRSLIVSAQQGQPPWKGYGLYQPFQIDTTWREYEVSFTANTTAEDARIQFFMGDETGVAWIDRVSLTKHPPDVFLRAFDHGLVLLNGARKTQSVKIGPGYRRLEGTQAPRDQLIVDNSSKKFSISAGTWVRRRYDSGLWKAIGPFYHNWGQDLCELGSSSGEARWSLPIPRADSYTLSVWIPAAPEALTWNKRARYNIVANGQVLASRIIDQTRDGDQWRAIATVALKPGDETFVSLECMGAPCVADAVFLESRGRYNDGSPAPRVTLRPMDGIILQKE